MNYLSSLRDRLLGLRPFSMSHRSSEWTIHEANVTLRDCLSKAHPGKPALPEELILQILDHPSRWVCSQKLYMDGDSEDSQSPEPLVRVSSMGGAPNMKVIASTKPLRASEIVKLRRLVFNFRSRDQGWSSYVSDHGTFKNSWSWFEASVKRDELRPERSDDEEELSSPETRLTGRYEVQSMASEGASYTYDRHDLQRNRHASKTAESHKIALHADHPLLESLQKGDIVDLLACAVFPGWQNLVYAANIEVWTHDDLSSLAVE